MIYTQAAAANLGIIAVSNSTIVVTDSAVITKHPN